MDFFYRAMGTCHPVWCKQLQGLFNIPSYFGIRTSTVNHLKFKPWPGLKETRKNGDVGEESMLFYVKLSSH
jgi:hypothetical protein